MTRDDYFNMPLDVRLTRAELEQTVSAVRSEIKKRKREAERKPFVPAYGFKDRTKVRITMLTAAAGAMQTVLDRHKDRHERDIQQEQSCTPTTSPLA